MSADIVNLRRARKARARTQEEAEAVANRIRFGRTKAERERAAAVTDLEQRRLAGHEIPSPRDPAKPDD